MRKSFKYLVIAALLIAAPASAVIFGVGSTTVEGAVVWLTNTGTGDAQVNFGVVAGTALVSMGIDNSTADNDFVLSGGGTLGTNNVFSIATATGNLTHVTYFGLTTTTNKGNCTLNGATPSVCTATVIASATCTCSIVGTTAALAAQGCAVSLASTTLTITSAAAATNVVNYHCF